MSQDPLLSSMMNLKIGGTTSQQESPTRKL